MEIEGLEELMKDFSDMVIDEAEEKRALNNVCKDLKTKLENSSPLGKTKKLKKIKKAVKSDGLGFSVVLYSGAFYDIFQEFGTSKQKAHVGYFERTVRQESDNVLKTLAQELIERKIK